MPKLVERLPNHAFVLNAVGVVYLRLAERHGDPALARQAADYLLRAAEMRQTVKNAKARLREFLAGLAKLCERYSHDAARLAGFEAQQGRIEQALKAYRPASDVVGSEAAALDLVPLAAAGRTNCG